jgi:hypothetical protein
MGWENHMLIVRRDQAALEATIAAKAAAELHERRKAMVCSRLQGRLTLGPEVCTQIDALAADPETPWAMRETILNAVEWQRLSQTMDELSYLLGFAPEQMDSLFEIAMTVSV